MVKAVSESPLRLSPRAEGQEVLVPIPRWVGCGCAARCVRALPRSWSMLPCAARACLPAGASGRAPTCCAPQLPASRPTADTLAAMAKVCKVEGEAAKVSVRHARKVAMDAAKKLASEDERKRAEKEVQKLTDDMIREVEGVVARKEQAIRSHDS